jgi:hypothetical protein
MWAAIATNSTTWLIRLIEAEKRWCVPVDRLRNDVCNSVRRLPHRPGLRWREQLRTEKEKPA